MSYRGRTFHRKPAPSKQAQRIDAQMVVLQRQAAGLDMPDYLAASIARTHGMATADVWALWDAETKRRAGR